MPVYIIEHLDKKVYPWYIFEYERISKLVGKKNLWFTNIKKPNKDLEKIGKTFFNSVSKMKLDKICVLDPDCSKTLTPKESKSFDYFIFGGILGDYPPRKRTKPLLTSKIKNKKVRNLGKEQFSTDTAVHVTNLIYSSTPLNKIDFIDSPEIKINNIESIILPFKYIKKNNKALMSKKVVDYLKNKKRF